MYKLIDVADVIRSKNSGPYELTFDIIFSDLEVYNKFFKASVITKESFAKLYKIDINDVIDVIYFDSSHYNSIFFRLFKFGIR